MLFLLTFVSSMVARTGCYALAEVMQRVDIYIKVEVDLDEDEKPERVAAEIVRQIEKFYPVRRAELQSTVNRD